MAANKTVFCRGCGKEILEVDATCRYCGAPQLIKNAGDGAAMRMVLPVGRSGWAIAAGYLTLISVLLVPAPFALACGIVAVRDIRRDAEKHGMGRAVFGIVMGTLGTVGLLLLSLTVLLKK